MIRAKEAGTTVLKFGAGAAGLTGGAFGLKTLDKLLPAGIPDILRKLAPGLATMLVAYLLNAKVSDEKAKALLFGLGLGGFADILRKTLGDKVPFIQENTPSLSGTPGYAAVNTGDFPPSYYLQNAFQGVPMNGGDAYALGGGVPMNGDAYALGETPYALT